MGIYALCLLVSDGVPTDETMMYHVTFLADSEKDYNKFKMRCLKNGQKYGEVLRCLMNQYERGEITCSPSESETA